VKVFKLLKYADDDEALLDIDDADFLARKIGEENKIDFSGVSTISAEFLDHLLAEQSFESLDGRIDGQAGKVEEELVAWLDRQQTVSPPPTTRSPPNLMA